MSAPAAVAAPALRRATSLRLGLGILPFATILLVFVLAALFAPVLAPEDPTRQALLARLRPPGSTVREVTYWLGTDEVGRDLLSRIIYGARASLMVAVLSVVASGAVGSLLGMMAGLARGWVEILVMRATDIMLSIPALLLAVLTVAVLGPGLINLVIVLGFARWPRYARVAYGQTLAVASLPYVKAARLAGASPARILWRHVTPNIVAPLIVVATLEFGLMVLFEASLSFLGLGIQPPTPSWGSILATGRDYVASAWWIATFPGLCLFLLVLSINLFGDWLRDRLDPRFAAR